MVIKLHREIPYFVLRHEYCLLGVSINVFHCAESNILYVNESARTYFASVPS